MAKKQQRKIPPVSYDRHGQFEWYLHKDLDPLDEPISSTCDEQQIGKGVVAVLEELGLLPKDFDLRAGRADQARDPLRLGDLLSPLFERLGLEPYRELPPIHDLQSIVNIRFAGEEYARLYLFIDDKLLNSLKIPESTAASYFAVLLGHISEKPLEVVEELLSRKNGRALNYNLRERLNWWRINGEVLSDLYDSLCKKQKCTGDCAEVHIQGFDYKGVCLLAAVLQESDPNTEDRFRPKSQLK